MGPEPAEEVAMAIERRAQAVWEGNLVRGRGRVRGESGPVAAGLGPLAVEVERSCPLSSALRGNLDIRVRASLEA
ncbi:MAG: hypothetical protein KY396_08845 [Actinobacteria bacterium]|nr:hypothetical protein [Actinomycetota bacterium]